jgi:ABC-type uncharacterized transport system substrate-binding protein
MRQWAIVNGRKFVNRKLVISLLGTLFLASVYPAEAGQAKVYRIGALFPGGPLSETIDGLRGGSRELGLEEAKQFTLAILDTKGDANAAEEAARKFEQEKSYIRSHHSNCYIGEGSNHKYTSRFLRGD